ncbi:MAG: DUF2240 family protein [Halobacteriales archaeon]
MLRRVVATPYRREHAGELRRSRVVYLLSAEYGWYTPSEAEEVVDAARESGLLAGDGVLEPSFDVDGVREAEGPPAVDDLVSTSAFDVAVSRLVDDGLSRREAVAEVNRVQARLGAVELPAAAVAAVAARGHDVDGLVDLALEELVSDG